MSELLDQIAYTFANLQNSDELKKLLGQALEKNIPVSEILESLRKGLAEVGKRYEAGDYFLSELLFSASIMTEAMIILAPRLKDQNMELKGSVVLGTVKGDLHDIGKNVFKMMAEGAGFRVLDLGVDVEFESFVEEIKQEQPTFSALSLAHTTIPEMRSVVERLDKVHVSRPCNGSAWKEMQSPKNLGET